MNRRILISSSFALVLALAACNPTTAPADKVDASVPAAASAADTAAVKQKETEYLGAFATKDYEAIKAHYAADATMVIPEMAPMTGIDAISADYDKFAADPAGKFVPTNQSTVVSSGGDLAYSQGIFTVTYTDSKTKAVKTANGYYILVYKKQPDGSWKIVQDISSPTA